MTADLALRRYRPADHDRVLAVHEAALRGEGVYIEGAPEPDLEDVEAAYPGADGEFLVGELAGEPDGGSDGELVATGAFRPAGGYITDYLEVDDATAEIKRMRVAPDHQGRGFGRRVYRELERRARERGFSALVLDTMPGLTAAQGLYESEGFERVRRERLRTEADGSFELLFYRKRLDG